MTTPTTTQTAPPVENLTTDDIRAGLANDTILLIDVREPDEFANAHIAGSVLVPLSSFDVKKIPAPGPRRLVFSCRSGRRSLTAAALAFDQGLPVDAHYAGGILDWIASGEPIESEI